MSLPGVSAGSVGSGGGGGGGTPVTPGGGSSGFAQYRVLAGDAAGAINQGPAPFYDFAVSAGDDFAMRVDMSLGGVGAVGGMYPSPSLVVGQAGNDFAWAGGTGGPASAGVAGGAGGLGQLYGGFGAAGSATRAAGRGGDVYIASAPGGANGGGGGARGGDVFIDGSEGTGGQRNGDVCLATVTVGVWGSRYVIVGPAGGTIPLLVDVAAPVSGELINVAGNTDALSLLGRAAIGSWVAATSCCFGHYAFRATATGYMLRGDQSGAATVLNVPTSGTMYFAAANVLGTGWRIDFTTGSAHFLPGTTATFDVGSASLAPRDMYGSRDFIGTSGAAHVHYTAQAAAGSGTSGGAWTSRAGHGAAATAGVTAANGGLGTFAGGNGGDGVAGRAPGSGGGAYLFGGDAGARVDTGNPSGGGVEIRGGVGRQAGAGGSVEVYAGASGTGGTAGHILLSVAAADGVYGYIRVGNSASERVGFYTTTGVAQQARPVTLADVINVLVNLGLTA